MAGQAAASSVGGQQGTLLSVNVDKGLGEGPHGQCYPTGPRSIQKPCLLIGCQICEAVSASFLLLVRDETRRVGGYFRYFLGPRGWRAVLSPAAPPHSVLLCMRRSSREPLRADLACHMGNNPETQSNLNY